MLNLVNVVTTQHVTLSLSLNQCLNNGDSSSIDILFKTRLIQRIHKWYYPYCMCF